MHILQTHRSGYIEQAELLLILKEILKVTETDTLPKETLQHTATHYTTLQHALSLLSFSIFPKKSLKVEETYCQKRHTFYAKETCIL